MSCWSLMVQLLRGLRLNLSQEGLGVALVAVGLSVASLQGLNNDSMQLSQQWGKLTFQSGFLFVCLFGFFF